MTVGQLAERVPVSRSAVSQHLQVRKAAERVVDEADGVRRHDRLQAAAPGELRAWVDGLWGDALGAFAQSGATDPRPAGAAKTAKAAKAAKPPRPSTRRSR